MSILTGSISRCIWPGLAVWGLLGLGSGCSNNATAPSGQPGNSAIPAPTSNGVQAGQTSNPNGGSLTLSPNDSATGIEVQSEPAGASVFVNGRLAGSTPVNLGELKPGVYGLRLEKSGRNAYLQTLQIPDSPIAQRLTIKLEPLASGSLKVDVKPEGAEVLLDGERVGLTPLDLPQAPAGTHEMVIRKTNFEPFTARIDIQPGQPQAFSGFELRDKMLTMLNGMVSSEPQRVNHYIDLAHYHFINNRMEEAARAYADAQAMAARPLEFPAEMNADERAMEMRLRSEDRARLEKELNKHRDSSLWAGKNNNLFKEKLAEEMDERTRKNKDSWEFLETSTREMIDRGQQARAEQELSAFMQRNPDSRKNASFVLTLIKVRLTLGKASELPVPVQDYLVAGHEQPDLLLKLGRMLALGVNRQPSWSVEDHATVLKLARESLNQAHDLAITGAAKGESAFELAQVYLQADPAKAVELFQESVTLATSPADKDDRLLALAEAQRLAGKLEEARKIFEALSKHDRADIREKAKAGLLRVQPATLKP